MKECETSIEGNDGLRRIRSEPRDEQTPGEEAAHVVEWKRNAQPLTSTDVAAQWRIEKHYRSMAPDTRRRRDQWATSHKGGLGAPGLKWTPEPAQYLTAVCHTS